MINALTPRSGTAGLNAAETLLAALGACSLTNVNAIAAKMRLPLHGAEVRFQAARRDEPAMTSARSWG